MNAPSRILIVKLGAVGDVVHTLYALRVLRRAFPDARIGWVVEDKSADALRGCPDVDEIFLFQRRGARGLLRQTSRYLEVGRALRTFGPDVAIDFQALGKSGLLAWLSGAPIRVGFDKWREANFLFTNVRSRSSPEEHHAVEKNLALLRPLGVDAGALLAEAAHTHPVRVPVSDVARARMNAYFDEHFPPTAQVVAVNPGASWPTKRWEPANFGRVARRLYDDTGAVPLVVWGPGEEEMATSAVRFADGAALLAPPTSIQELAQLLFRCHLYLGGDTGPMHIAAAMGTPAVALFAPSNPARVHPWNVAYEAVVPPDGMCHHCWERKRCPNRCIEHITVDRVVAAVERMLAEAA